MRVICQEKSTTRYDSALLILLSDNRARSDAIISPPASSITGRNNAPEENLAMNRPRRQPWPIVSNSWNDWSAYCPWKRTSQKCLETIPQTGQIYVFGTEVLTT